MNLLTLFAAFGLGTIVPQVVARFRESDEVAWNFVVTGLAFLMLGVIGVTGT
jgi:O-antigen/teichoic acid export membrane protein